MIWVVHVIFDAFDENSFVSKVGLVWEINSNVCNSAHEGLFYGL